MGFNQANVTFNEFFSILCTASKPADGVSEAWHLACSYCVDFVTFMKISESLTSCLAWSPLWSVKQSRELLLWCCWKVLQRIHWNHKHYGCDRLRQLLCSSNVVQPGLFKSAVYSWHISLFHKRHLEKSEWKLRLWFQGPDIMHAGSSSFLLGNFSWTEPLKWYK